MGCRRVAAMGETATDRTFEPGDSLESAMMNIKLSASLMLVAATAACTAGLEPLPPEWTIAIPAGTPVHEYPPVPIGERGETVAFERDLVLREAFGRGLYRPMDVATDADGRVFVLDQGNSRIVGFDPSGAARVEFGGEGQGPGQMRSPSGFGVAGDRVVLSDYQNARITEYATDGAHIGDHLMDDRFYLRDVVSAGDDIVVLLAPPLAMSWGGRPQPDIPWTIARYTRQGAEIARLIELTGKNKAIIEAGGLVGRLPVVVANPVGALTPDGAVYATAGDEYQVVAVGADGTYAWALRVAWPVEPFTEERKQQLIDAYVAPREEFTDPTYLWPQRYAAIENLEIDGRGRLWVFPYVYRPVGVDPGPQSPVPVDIYSPAGELLFTGLSPIGAWDGQHGAYVFCIEDDGETGEQIVARYRVLTDID